MTIKRNIEKEVSKTLQSFDEVSEVKAKPYFYTRLTAKMDNRQRHLARIWNWGLASMTVIILINVASLLSLWPESQETDEVIELMASEYSLNNTDIYSTTIELEP